MTSFGGWTVGEQQFADRVRSGETLVGKAVREIIAREFAGMRIDQITPELQRMHDEMMSALAAMPSAAVYMQRKTVVVPAVSVVIGSASQEVVVSWNPQLPNTNYGVYPAVLTGNTGLFGKVVPQPKPGANTKDQATIVVTTTAVLSASAVTLDVLALGTV